MNFSALAANAPGGTLLELHSCELYAGGCIVSSEATQGGRYMLRAWNFTEGSFAGHDLAGLKVALLQISGDNLAARDSSPAQSVVYLPGNATEAQRSALQSWLKGQFPDLGVVTARVVPLSFDSRAGVCQFAAGDFISIKAASLDSCPTGGCGETLWYTPRTENSLFTVAVNRSSKVNEPQLKLKWEDAGKRSVFLARFGEATPARNLYVSLAELCGQTGKLF